MPESFQRIIASLLEFSTPLEESSFCNHVLREIDHHRRIMGWDRDNLYRPGSFLHKLDIAQRKYEQDFDYRATIDPLFAESNIALNPILTQINQHSDKLGNDLLNSPAFFTAKPQGPEDAADVINILKERLIYRSRKINLHERCKAAAKGAFIRGQEIVMTSYASNAYLRPTEIKVIKVDGVVVKDSSGTPVLDADKWINDPADPESIILEKELDLPNKIRLPANTAFQTGNSKVVLQQVQNDPGADVKVIYYGDFFTVLNANSLEDSYLNGHAFRSNVGDLIQQFPAESLLPAAKEYLEADRLGKLALSGLADYTVEADAPRRRDGEDEDTALLRAAENDNAGRFKRRSFYYAIIRYDADKDGHAEDIYCIIDVAEKRILHYEYAALMFPWNKAMHPTPYACLRIWPKLHRWTGTGMYDLLEAWETLEDRMTNRIEVDSATSGNVIFEDPSATTAGVDGPGIQFRTREAYELRPGRSVDEALQVKTVQPANVEIFSAMADKYRARIELTGGTTSPQDSSTTDIPGSDTLGVAKILENTANQGLRARESEIIVGLTSILHSMADIEAWASVKGLNEDFLIAQLGPEKAAALVEWFKLVGDDYRNSIEVNLSKSSSSQMVEINNAILNILDRWFAYNPALYDTVKPLFENILMGFDVPNPDALLNTDIATAASQMAQLAAVGEQAQAQQAKAPQDEQLPP